MQTYMFGIYSSRRIEWCRFHLSISKNQKVDFSGFGSKRVETRFCGKNLGWDPCTFVPFLWFRLVAMGRQLKTYDCFSCMSKSYEKVWYELHSTFYQPSNYSDACQEPKIYWRAIQTVKCQSPCLTIVEPVVTGGAKNVLLYVFQKSFQESFMIAGVQVGQNYMRGCMDRTLLLGFSEEFLARTSLNVYSYCRFILREELYDMHRQAGNLDYNIHPRHYLKICSCRSSRCNGGRIPMVGNVGVAHGRKAGPAFLHALPAVLLSLFVYSF